MNCLQPHVFVRRDAVRRPLQPSYDGPFQVLSCTDKHFTLDLGNRTDSVSVNRLKPTHLDLDYFNLNTSNQHSTPQSLTTTPTNTPTRTLTTTPTSTTRSGRHVRFPRDLCRNVS